MNKEEKEYKSAVLQLQTALDFHNSNSLGEYSVNWESVELILEYIENLQKKAELGDHYKHLYSELKKQKDDVVDWVKNNYCYVGKKMSLKPYSDLNDLLRMLGEIDVED